VNSNKNEDSNVNKCFDNCKHFLNGCFFNSFIICNSSVLDLPFSEHFEEIRHGVLSNQDPHDDFAHEVKIAILLAVLEVIFPPLFKNKATNQTDDLRFQNRLGVV